MKIIISYNKINFVDLTPEQVEKVRDVAGNHIVKEVSNGFTVRAEHGVLYGIICELSFIYDIEIV